MEKFKTLTPTEQTLFRPATAVIDEWPLTRTASSSIVRSIRNTEPFFTRWSSQFHDCGYIARCALEVDDSGLVRIQKIEQIIADCRFGIHDISRVEADPQTQLPRFNMPLDLGLFLGAKRYGNKRQKAKSCKILDTDKYRFQKFCSDISGQDISAHHGDPEEAIKAVRNWFGKTRRNVLIPSGSQLAERYRKFQIDLPILCQPLKLTIAELTFLDFQNILVEWLRANPW